MNINKELIFKESLPFFKNLSKEEKNILYDASHIEEYKAGELIYSKYKSCTGLVLVANGQLRSFMSSLSGKEITLFKLFKNDLCILSSSCFYQNLSYDINLQAVDNSSLIIIDGKLFKDLLNQNISKMCIRDSLYPFLSDLFIFSTVSNDFAHSSIVSCGILSNIVAGPANSTIAFPVPSFSKSTVTSASTHPVSIIAHNIIIAINNLFFISTIPFLKY